MIHSITVVKFRTVSAVAYTEREMCISESSCLCLIRSSVVEQLRVRRFAVIQARDLLYSIL